MLGRLPSLFFFFFFIPFFEFLLWFILCSTTESDCWSLSQHLGAKLLYIFGLKYAEVISIELQKSWVVPCTFICLISYRIILWVSRGSSLAGTTFSLEIFARITEREKERKRFKCKWADAQFYKQKWTLSWEISALFWHSSYKQILEILP